VKGNRDHRVDIVENVRADIHHEPCNGPGERTPTVVFERVDDVAEAPVVKTSASGEREVGRTRRAAGADVLCRWQRVAADDTQRGRNTHDRAPARVTDSSGERPIEHGFATDAHRCEKRADDVVGG
jgi:hypothetical protein